VSHRNKSEGAELFRNPFVAFIKLSSQRLVKKNVRWQDHRWNKNKFGGTMRDDLGPRGNLRGITGTDFLAQQFPDRPAPPN